MFLLSFSTDPLPYIESVLAKVDIVINGDRPWDLQVHNKNLYIGNITCV